MSLPPNPPQPTEEPLVPKDTGEDIEGLQNDEDSAWGGDYPIDTVLVRHETRTVHDIMRRIKQGNFVLNPEFQRGFIWQDNKQSKLVESVLMRIPLPVFYLAENDIGQMVVVDGLQRLSTFQWFLNNELRLKLPHHTELHGKYFKDLSPKLQNRIEDCNLILYTLDSKLPEQARLDMFERVNSGQPLSRQQMRNCMFMGEATRFLKKESNTPFFKQATGNSLAWRTMRDREFVNRFCAFQLLSLESYRGDMDEFLAKALKQMNAMETENMEKLSCEFRMTLRNNFMVFHKHAFRKHSPDQSYRNMLNASLWDVMSTGLSRYPKNIVNANAKHLREAFSAMLNNEEFLSAISKSTGGVKQVKIRFRIATAMLEDVFGC